MIKIVPAAFLFILFLTIGGTPGLLAQEGRRLNRSEVPEKLLEAATRIGEIGRPRFLERNQDGRRFFVVYSKRTGRDREWYFDSSGGMLGHCRPIPPDSIPSEIFPFFQVVLDQRLENPQIRKCRFIHFEEVRNYELEVHGKQGRNNFLVRFLFDEKGRLMEESEVGTGRFDRII